MTHERLDRTGYRLRFDERFSEPTLSEDRWIPHYLPQWSSRERARARYAIEPDGLHLRVEPDQSPWAPEWDGDVRVSGLQTGVRSGPVGSRSGQHRFRPDLVVREEQDERLLYAPHYGLVEIRARAIADPNAMVALWLIGVERQPEQSGELCVMEIFGRDLTPEGGMVGMGVHPFGDPALHDEFGQVHIEADLTQPHDYAVEWMPGSARFYVDGHLVQTIRQAPAYPMQLMLDVFAFHPDDRPKDFVVHRVRGWAPQD